MIPYLMILFLIFTQRCKGKRKTMLTCCVAGVMRYDCDLNKYCINLRSGSSLLLINPCAYSQTQLTRASKVGWLIPQCTWGSGLSHCHTYITIRQQELRTCKRIGYELYCEELFMVKH